MNEEELTSQFHTTSLFDDIDVLSDYVLSALDLSEEDRRTVESFIGEAVDKAFVEGFSAGMADIIKEDLDWK